MRTVVATASVLISFAVISTLEAQEKKIKRADLPAAVERTVAEQSKGATIRELSTEIENGRKLYEAALIVDGHGRDILIDEQGTIVEVEEEMALASLPPAVKEGLTKAAGRGTITKVEALTKKGKLVAYEAIVKTGTKQTEVQVGPDGKKLARPE